MDTRTDRKAQTHERIVQAAACAVRRAGYQGVSVGEVMKAAGLTHGGFYAHFASRDAMLVEALERADQDSARRLARRLEQAPGAGLSPLRALVESYLSDAHLAAVDQGCPVAALASEMPRQAPEVAAASRATVHGLVERVRQALPAPANPQQATVIAASLVGALQLARVLGPGPQGRTMLAAMRTALLERYDLTTPR